ncbi:NADPH-dependent 7-cyano-7-deazaguanine reductase QueF [Candidatus Erwinia haradaeae]|uniref:NADPH-dependent 7-cyano-7-deazaguanine reductase n=1 Tax=Candidatus Erwinia haradaeae TaxID=1922217 RepID=A0A451DA32_9GAMM|nr:NADPH-dependent 7-cyano-7-deazaguanine reductase QueF [Candidatus Erwinia haradaeae]VFP83124.1 NADPH-dependent 7-cyano-7-deazaguanine reductase [Candidatus Erwinia haradaeae]
MSKPINQSISSIAGKFLGQKTKYYDTYQPSLLHAVPRSLNRELLGSDFQPTTLMGQDIWTLYEVSWLNQNGLPQVSIGKVVLSMHTINLIESKSLKLYLNSFNQTQFTNLAVVQNIIERDLSDCAIGLVKVTLFRLKDVTDIVIDNLSGFCIDEQNITIHNYKVYPDFLYNITHKDLVKEQLISHLFKSNCLITKQPDWATVQISYYGPRIDHVALLHYLVSYRQHNEFHESCTERIFYDILRYCKPYQLSVYLRYTRRGGIDINPWRSNTEFSPTHHRLVRQ